MDDGIQAALQMYDRKRQHGEIDLVFELGRRFKKFLGEEDMNHFLKDSTVTSIYLTCPEGQRIILSQWLNSLLLRYSSLRKADINEVLRAIIIDGDVNDWLALVDDYVIPYIVNNNVIKEVYGG